MGAWRDPFGVAYPIKQLLINCLGYASYWPLNVSNSLTIRGEEHLRSLPDSGVLMVSNHQTGESATRRQAANGVFLVSSRTVSFAPRSGSGIISAAIARSSPGAPATTKAQRQP